MAQTRTATGFESEKNVNIHPTLSPTPTETIPHTHLGVALVACECEGRLELVVPGVEVGAQLDQLAHHLRLRPAARHVQRRVTVHVLLQGNRGELFGDAV